MSKYIKTEIVDAKEMDENTFLCTIKDEDVTGKETRDGYKVIDQKGQVSWVEKTEFEATYTAVPTAAPEAEQPVEATAPEIAEPETTEAPVAIEPAEVPAPAEVVETPATAEPKTTDLTFGEAVEALSAGKRVARATQTDEFVWLPNLDGSATTLVPGVAEPLPFLPVFGLKTADNKIVTGWLPSASDILAKDWAIVA